MSQTDVPPIIPRLLTKKQKPFDDNEPEHWLNNTQVITEFIHSMSVLFPEGENFFVRSVRAFCDDERISGNKKLMKEVKAFISQEAQHSAEHASYNRKIGEMYQHDIGRIDRLVRTVFSIPEKSSIFFGYNKYVCLGITCSLEHLTAGLAELLLTTKEGHYVISAMSPSHRALWVWHAIEETEHKAVAYDVYCAAGGWYTTRVFRHLISTAIFIAVVSYINIQFMIDRANCFDFVGMWKLFHFLMVFPGVLRHFFPLWLEYFRPGFHPWQDQANRAKMTAAIKEWSEKLNLSAGKHVKSNGHSQPVAHAQQKVE